MERTDDHQESVCPGFKLTAAPNHPAAACRSTAVGLFVLLLMVARATTASAQTVSDGRVWWNVTAQERAGTPSPWRWYFELQGRTRDGVDDMDQLLVRPAVGYDVTRRSSIWGGYGYTPSYPPGGDVLHEHRAWQQYLWAGPMGSPTLQLQWRSRLEERWIESNRGVAWRYRQFVRLTRQLGERSGGPTLVVWDEVFAHVNDTTRTTSGFDQNRLFVGLGVGVGPRTRLEVGYLNQALESARGPDRRNHILLGFLNATF
jgi:hypothetical protein